MKIPSLIYPNIYFFFSNTLKSHQISADNKVTCSVILVNKTKPKIYHRNLLSYHTGNGAKFNFKFINQ